MPPISSRTTSGSSRCSTARIRACSVSGVSPGSTGTASCRSTAPVSTPSSTRWTVAPVSVDAGRERLLDGVGSGERGEQRRMHVHDSTREPGEEHRPQQVHVARAQTTSPTPCDSSQSAIAASRASRSG